VTDLLFMLGADFADFSEGVSIFVVARFRTAQDSAT